jgi:hypothetical protein
MLTWQVTRLVPMPYVSMLWPCSASECNTCSNHIAQKIMVNTKQHERYILEVHTHDVSIHSAITVLLLLTTASNALHDVYYHSATAYYAHYGVVASLTACDTHSSCAIPIHLVCICSVNEQHLRSH